MYIHVLQCIVNFYLVSSLVRDYISYKNDNIRTKLKKLVGQTNIDKYRVTVNKSYYSNQIVKNLYDKMNILTFWYWL